MDITEAWPVRPAPEHTAGVANHIVRGLVSSHDLKTRVIEVMGPHTVNEEPAPLSSAFREGPVPMWNAASGRFHPVQLRAAIVARGWTVGEFAAESGVSRACLYNALNGLAVSDRTVVRVATTLGTRIPSVLLAAE